VSVFWLWRKIVLGVTYLPYQLCCCVFFLVAAGNSSGLHRSVFWLWREIVLGVTYVSAIPVVPFASKPSGTLAVDDESTKGSPAHAGRRRGVNAKSSGTLAVDDESTISPAARWPSTTSRRD
jgi:hypothetical protein